ncbi:putative membrane protein, partial [Streptomyces himastatinicus ATCC 53653]
ARPTAPTAPTAPASPTSPTSPAGTGTFVTAKSSGKVIGGAGDVRRFKVQVEEGTGIDPKKAAAEISAVLADERGWTRDRKHSFQLVSGGDFDFEVKIATPDTVDDICGQAGLKTRGEVNCAAGTQVMVNLKRWNTGSPEFDGPIGEYRALIVNHEVGHRIGHGHETCPGPGKPAPAMMQQIDGLKGCVANAWPYSKAGRYLGGPSVA